MSPAATLTPALALDYLRELSADVLAGAVLAPDGTRLAGAEDVAAAARSLLGAAPGGGDVHVATAGHAIFAARSDAHAIVLVCGRFALPSLVRHDLRRVLADLAGDAPEDARRAAKAA